MLELIFFCARDGTGRRCALTYKCPYRLHTFPNAQTPFYLTEMLWRYEKNARVYYRLSNMNADDDKTHTSPWRIYILAAVFA